MPRKEFASFTRLDASDVNTYLMDQTVQTFAGTAARGSAIGTASEGMVTYLNDINSLSVNNGNAWTTDRTIQVFGGTAARGSAIPSPVEGMVTYLDDINSLSVNNGTAWTTDRTIQVFAGTAARGSAITSPIEGMYAHLNDTDTLTYYNGSAWANAGASSGLTLIRSATLTGVSTLSLGSNADPIFSSTYDNYKVIIVTKNSADASRSYTLRLRANTTDESGSVYSLMAVGIDRLGSANNNFGVNATSLTISNNAYYAIYPTIITFDINGPFIADDTGFIGGNNGFNASHSVHQSFSAFCVTNTSYNGLTVTNSSGNFSDGTIQIYGYAKA
jgi:hypothetical protein